MDKKDATYWVKLLRLEPHPEGGYFRQTYRSEVTIAREALPAGFGGDRAASTAIYFLLEGKNFSAFHRLRSVHSCCNIAISLVEVLAGRGTRATSHSDHFAAVAFLGNISPMRRICAPTPLNFSSMCS